MHAYVAHTLSAAAAFAGPLLKRVVPRPALDRYRDWRDARKPRIGHVHFGDLRRLEPVARGFGHQFGTPVDRWYIEKFLQANVQHIHGRVLEIADGRYTKQFGGARVMQSDVLGATALPGTTMVGDLSRPADFPEAVFDCEIITQTFQYIYDYRAAIRSLHKMLKPGGVLLLTMPCISQISTYDRTRWGEYWRFTSMAAAAVFGEFFSASCSVSAYGNVLIATGSLYGLLVEDFTREELDFCDPEYEVIVAIAATKAP